MSKLWIYVIVLLYLSVIAYLGWLGFKRTKNDQDYLIAGGDMHPFLLAMTYGATFISTSAIVGFGGAASLFGMGLLWLTFLNIFVGIFIAFVVFGKRTLKMGRKLGTHTFPEFLGERYQSKFIQGFSGLIIFAGMPLYAAAVMIGAARFIESTLGIPYIPAVLIFSLIIAAYVMSGGMKGVFYTDALQGIIMFIGMVILIFLTYIKLGGILTAHQALTNLSSYAEMFAAAGHQGWTQMPVAGSNFWYTLVTSMILGVGIGVLAQPQLIVRFLTVKGPKELNRATLIGGIFILFMTGVVFVVGSLTNVYFMETKGVISFLAADNNIDRVIPIYINEAMPEWFSYIFTLTLIAAAMSTLSSVFHTMGTSISRDVYQKAITKGNPKYNTLTINRVGIVVSLLITVWLAFILPGGIIAAATAILFSITSASFLPAYCLGLFWPRATKLGAIFSMVGGLLFALFWLVFVQASNAERIGISQYLTGAVSIASPPWAWMEAIVVALPFSLVIMIIVSLLTQPMTQEHLEKTYGKGVELN